MPIHGEDDRIENIDDDDMQSRALPEAPLIRHPAELLDSTEYKRRGDHSPVCGRPTTPGSWVGYIFKDLVWSNGIFCSFMAAFLHSIEPIFVKSLPHTSPFALAMLRSCIALPVALLLVSLSARPSATPMTKQQYCLYLPRSP
jgi:hypothetical protein